MSNTESPTVDGKTREQRAAELEAMDKMAPLLDEAAKVNVTIKPGTSKEEARKLILDATFGVDGEAGKGTAAASEEDEEEEGAKGKGNAAKGPKKGKAADEANPLAEKHKELDAALGGLYDQLVERITEVQAEGAEGGDVEPAEQIRAGAVQFLRQCNATLEEARNLIVDAGKIVETNNAQLQSINKAKADLEKRSNDYAAMTNKGEKNVPGQE